MSTNRPVIQPVRKGESTPEIETILKEIQDTMGIPWAPATWRAYARYPLLMELFWERLKPVVSTESFITASLEITERAYRGASNWYRPGFRTDLPGEDHARVQWELDAFEFGNPQILMQQAVLSRALDGIIVGELRDVSPRKRASSYRRPELVLIDEAEASEEIRSLYEDIRLTLDLPLVNSDYQALAKWPSFLRAAWEDARPWRSSAEYRQLELEIAEMAWNATSRVSPPVQIATRELQVALGDSESVDAIRDMVRSFTNFMPGLILSDAMFRIGAANGRSVKMLMPQGKSAPHTGTRGAIERSLPENSRGVAAVAAGMMGAMLLGAGIRWLMERREARY